MEKTYKFYDKKNLGIERKDMPQISKDNLDDFLLHYADKVKVSKLKMSLSLIKPTQNEINEEKVLQMMASECDWKDRVYIISSDNYLLDGHHSYAIGLELDDKAEVTVYRVNLKMKDLLSRTKKLKIATKVDIDDNIIKDEEIGELVKAGCRIVTDIHLEQTLQDVYEEYGFEKAIPTHLVKKIIINKQGHSQTVYIDPTKKDGMKFDFKKHPYKGSSGAFLGAVEMAIHDVLKKKDVKFQTALIDSKNHQEVEIVGKEDEKVEWYKTKNFNENGVIGIKHGGKIHEKKIKDHEIEVEKEKDYLDTLEDNRAWGKKLAEKIDQATQTDPASGLQEFGGFKVGELVKFKDGDKELAGKIKSIKYHEKYDKFGTVLIEDDDSGKIFSRSLKKVEKLNKEAKKEAIEKLMALHPEEPTQSLSDSMKGNQNAKKDNKPEEYKVIKKLGGTNNANLVEDTKGNKWVVKTLTVQAAENEFAANKIYESFGLAVPEVKFADGKLYAKYIPDTIDLGVYLQTASIIDKGKIYKQVKDGFIADALLANWDVVGLSLDNIVVDPATKKVYRIDNGGSLMYRAQGAKKGDEFQSTVTEIESLSNPKTNANTAQFFKGISDEEKAKQAKHIFENSNVYLEHANKLLSSKSVEDQEYGAKMIKRLSSLETLYNKEIKPAAKAEGYHANGLYKKTGIPEVDEVYEKVDKIMSISETDKAYYAGAQFNSERSYVKNLYDNYMQAKNNGSTAKEWEWYGKALKAGATPDEIYYIKMYTGGSYGSFNNALSSLTNVVSGNINTKKLILSDAIASKMMNVKLNVGDNHGGDNYYNSIVQAAKTLNHHHEDKQYNQNTLNTFQGVQMQILNTLKDAKTNPANYSKADLNMLKYYKNAAFSVASSIQAKAKVNKIEQYKLTEVDVKEYNAAIDKAQKAQDKEKGKNKSEIKFKNGIEDFASENIKKYLVFSKFLTSGLAKLEKSGKFQHKGAIYRKLSDSGMSSAEDQAFLHKHAEGDIVFWQRNNSCSKESAVWSGEYRFTITKHNGVDVQDISNHYGEKEVMLKPFTSIKVNQVVKSGHHTLFSVEQIA